MDKCCSVPPASASRSAFDSRYEIKWLPCHEPALFYLLVKTRVRKDVSPKVQFCQIKRAFIKKGS